MTEPLPRRPLTTLRVLRILAGVFACVPIVCGAAIVIIEHYMAITPADWPTPGGLIDRANDFACVMLLLPSSTNGRFYAGLIFYLIPILIEMRKGEGWRALLFAACILLPENMAYQFAAFSASGATYLLIVLLVFPMLIASWTSMTGDPQEKRLMRACLVILWITWFLADLLLGIGVHRTYCKPIIVVPISQ